MIGRTVDDPEIFSDPVTASPEVDADDESDFELHADATIAKAAIPTNTHERARLIWFLPSGRFPSRGKRSQGRFPDRGEDMNVE